VMAMVGMAAPLATGVHDAGIKQRNLVSG
jgi:hypothetical protein